ncbi:unnamed protein product [Ceratitis capitata]|uniref:(Mediterranean fruit fly) hypothetical protein n=1 Tax=Ceratitis capitata TaxID=7213 RepID=W8B289_CERCA|nr:unnamed protein product [Ceratitis capitata]CAD6998284.1 unnamed protein product [Ceratitis capitata]CAD7001739.1 unnamed protein product [Ceratitis capitata]
MILPQFPEACPSLYQSRETRTDWRSPGATPATTPASNTHSLTKDRNGCLLIHTAADTSAEQSSHHPFHSISGDVAVEISRDSQCAALCTGQFVLSAAPNMVNRR